MELTDKHYLIVGGSSGMGLATAELALARGASVEIIGRSAGKLDAAAKLLASDRLTTTSLDMTDEPAVKDFFADKADASIDALVISASNAVHGPFETAETADVTAMFASKFMGPFVLVREALPKMREGGSITFFSGVLSRRPGRNGAGLAAVNAAVEGLGRALALELGPRLRVNTVAPGMARTDAYAAMPAARREAMFRSVADGLPVKRVADAADIAEAAMFLSTNRFTTGHVLDVDGGHLIAG
ncbi:SDR family oxidoreductase [Tateyamaria armeniaca]|uniref:SDR family oxidoreductase n=1 Tax=Tateyamaria armeniaca TaxID=2518930 RepID=A0ABW8UMY7_9RHOB